MQVALLLYLELLTSHSINNLCPAIVKNKSTNGQMKRRPNMITSQKEKIVNLSQLAILTDSNLLPL